ncbi:MAG TPA: NUDIX hydrolase [Acidobacteriota bacterium]|nr:NUDIX hydrolase [Acidobacteriota bacterium]
MKREANCYLAADSIVISGDEVLLVQRKNDPFAGRWAIPGGFVHEDERLLDAAKRELREETGITEAALQYFNVYGEPGRDPRGRTVTFVYWLDAPKKPDAKAGDDAADCRWFPLPALPQLAFDHNRILQDALARIHEIRPK